MRTDFSGNGCQPVCDGAGRPGDGGKPVEFGDEFGINELNSALNKDNNLVIIRYIDIDDGVKSLKYNVIDKGRKYMLVERSE